MRTTQGSRKPADTARAVTGHATSRPDADNGPLGTAIGIGEIIDQRYRVIELLGEGGMGAVFKVEHTRMGKLMALKLLLRNLARDRQLVQAFEQEAQIVSKLSCTNTVSVFDFGEIATHGLYMAMEYVPGRDLATLLAADGAFHERSVIGVAIQVLHSLAEAHDAGIIHRDIKPANLMLLRTRDARDFVKVLDFGIARLVGTNADHGEGTFQGTAHYAAPEQIRGQSVDGRADLYALAATLFELVTGRPPFMADTPVQVCVEQLTKQPPRPRDIARNADISLELEDALMKALSKDPAQRFVSADEMRAAFEGMGEQYSHRLAVPQVKALRDAVAVDESIAQRDDWDSFEQAFRRGVRLRRWSIIAAAVIVCGGAAAIAGLTLHRLQRQNAAQQAAVENEREPNDEPSAANVLTVGRVVRGTIGRRLSDTDSDLDAFQLEVKAPARLRVRLTPVPNVNVALEVLARRQEGGKTTYRTIARADDQPMNAPAAEQIDDLAVLPGTYVVQLRDRRRPSERDVTRPRENSTDLYELSVTLDPEDPLAEREPDDTLEDAQRVQPRAIDQPVLGHSGQFAARDVAGGVSATRWSDDHYVFRLGAAATRACALVVGVPGASLGLQLASLPGTATAARTTLRDRSLGVACVAARGQAHVTIELQAGGNLDERYLLVVTDDTPEGRAGARRAAELLSAQGHDVEAKALTARADALK